MHRQWKKTKQDAPSKPSEKEEKKETAEKEEKGKQTEEIGKKKERILINSAENPEPLCMEFGPKISHKAIKDMIGMVEEGQRMIFKCSPKQYVGEEYETHLESVLKAMELKIDDELIVDIKIDKIMTKEERLQGIEAQRTAQLATDKKIITDYLDKHDIKANSTDSGLFYIVDQLSEAVAVTQNKMVKVNYTGKLLDGTIFDTSIAEVAKANNLYNEQRTYEPFEFQVGTGQVIHGWDEGLLLLHKHEKARFFIPSCLAYGTKRIGKIIPENAILIFEVEVVDVL